MPLKGKNTGYLLSSKFDWILQSQESQVVDKNLPLIKGMYSETKH
jgi:hypothetical protein